MNLGKQYVMNGIPFRCVFLSTGEHTGYLVDGVKYLNDAEQNHKIPSKQEGGNGGI